MKAQEAMEFFHKSSKGLIRPISSPILKCVIKFHLQISCPRTSSYRNSPST